MPEDIQERLAAARKAKAVREEKAQADADAKELAILEIEAKLTDDGGTRGKDFEIVDTIEGVIVVKRVDAIVLKQWDDGCSKLGTKPVSTDMLLRFTMPAVTCPPGSPPIVCPTSDAYKALVLGDADHPGATGIALEVAWAVKALHGSKAAAAQGKA